MAGIELDHVTKRYPGGVPAVKDLSLDIPDGDFMVLVGPSGSGKSTALVRDDGPAVTFADYKLPVPEQAIAAHRGLERFWDHKVIIGLRPSSLEDAAFAPEAWPQLKAQAQVTEQLGAEVDVIFAVRTPPVEHETMTVQFDKAPTDQHPTGEHHDQTSGLVDAGASLWTAKLNPKTSARPGRAIDLAADTSALYWFDPDSGLAITRQPNHDQPSTRQDTTHLDQIRLTGPASPVEGREECLKRGSGWVHLRMCQTCGKIGCCDSFPNRHASRHARADGHPGGSLG